jgi:hypothetical protein
MSLLRADKITNRFKNSGPIIVGPSSVTGDFTVSGILTALGIGVTNDVLVGGATTTKFLTAQNSANLFNTTLTGITTVGVITGGTYFGNGVNLTGIVTSIAAGAGVIISPGSGQGRVTISANNVAIAGFAVTAGVSTNIKGGAAGAIPYQTAVNNTGFSGVGNTGEILQSQGPNSPVWTSLAAINVSFADSAGISTNLKGGSAGRIPVQSGIDQTTFMPVGVTGNIILAQGTSTPIYIDPKASLDVRRARFAGIATNLQSGYISSATSLEVIGVTTLGITTASTLDVTGITTTGRLDVSLAANITNLTLSTGPGVGVTAILDEDDMVSDRADALVTQQSIKAYVDSQVTAQDLDGNADSGTFVVDLDSQELGVRGTSNEVITVGAGQSVTVGLDTNVTIPNNLTVTTNSQVNGISSVGSAITMYGSTGIVSATAFYGDGTNLTNVLGIGNSVTNIIFVSPDGDDIKDGRRVSTAKRTVGSALTIAEASTVIRISAGNYSENNPLILPEQVTLLGDSLREVSLSPQNADKDFIYVANGSYVENMSFTGTLNEGKAIISFNPDKPSFVTQGPYIRNCTNFITNSIGMKIDGASVIGPTRAMNVDSYTQLNQGGIGVSISNEGYAQLVSIFTIYNDQSIICINGGQCDLTNSNSSFGRLGLVADGIGPQQFIGTVTTATAANSDTFTLNVGVNTLGVTTAEYTASSGIVTITTSANHNFNKGLQVEIRDLQFRCSPGGPTTSFPSGNFGNIFTVDAVGAANSFSAFVGVSTLSHDYVNAGVVSTFVTRPYDGQVVYIDSIFNSISGVAITNGGSGYTTPPAVTFSDPSESWGIKATGNAVLTNGVVTSVDMISNGRGYTGSPTVTIAGAAAGTPNILPTYYVVSSATPIVGGISTVTFTERVPYAVGVGSTVPFYKQSRVLASSHAFEYIGSGNTFPDALPARGGVAIPENEIVNKNGGLVIFTSTDQAGNFKIGDGVIINQLEGSISGDAYNRSLFANITPYILALGGGD